MRWQLAPVVVLVSLATLTTVAGCTVARPTGFDARTDATCGEAMMAVGDLDAPADPAAGLRYALDRYVIVEKVVATVTDSALPGGDAGRALRDRWLRPARASLRSGSDALRRLRDASRANDRAAAMSAFSAAAAAGATGVDLTLLVDRSLPRCAALFAAPAPATSW
ncbi:MAG: hypothetical protein ABJB98_08050 [Actinomycetota bacterium]